MTPPSRQPSMLLPAEAFSTDDDSNYLPWKIAFRVKFSSEKIGLRFHPAHFPDTGNGIYTIRLLELTKGPDGGGPAQQYNKHLQPGQEHLTLRPGLYLTHINDNHLIEVPCEEIIDSLQKTPRPITLRFVDVEAGVVTRHELRDSLHLDGEALSAAIAQLPSSQSSSPRRPSPTKVSGDHLYKIILLGTAGVGKSSLLAVATNGDDAYMNRRPPTLEAEFGTIEFPDPSDYTGTKFIKARIWDTAGQERFRAITRSHYRRADGALLVYDVSDSESFERLGEWLHTLRETAGDSLTSAMVLENKVDKLPPTGSRPAKFAQPDKVQAFCEMHSLLFGRTTAKLNARAREWDGLQVFDAVRQLVLHIHETRTRPASTTTKQPESDTKDRTESVMLTNAMAKTPKALGDCGGCNAN
ncbi:Rab11 family GTPase [Phytophthora palmivora]|uniref:Rab11 family GTPase n=1 Tax=Phytophthora palmivora TaxID=4796 RepID=A0A2P4XER3_9STRA|nr:Rab11 family GTPase [Phytophthora palmivora]